MTQAFNLALLANKVNSSGQLDASTGLYNTPIPTGTVVLFYQSAAPTGWTQVTTLNDYDLRLVSGVGGTTGGTTAYSTVFANQTVSTTVSGTAGATTLSTAQLASHAHSTIGSYLSDSTGGFPAGAGCPGFSFKSATSAAGSGGSHTHGTPTFTGTSHNHTASSSFSGTAINLAVQYIDVIICSKN